MARKLVAWNVVDSAGCCHTVNAHHVVAEDGVVTYYVGCEIVGVFCNPASARRTTMPREETNGE